jgi:riboflavin biosynthesis pyrimidine reductase
VILVGAGTVRTEGYRAVDLAPWQLELRAAEGLSPYPTLAIVTSSVNLDPRIGTPAVGSGGPVVIITARSKADRDLDLFRAAQVAVIEQDHEGIDLAESLDWLAGQGLHRVLCEGGLVDELSLTLAPVAVGGAGLRSTRGAAIEPVATFELELSLYADDGALFTRYVRRRQVVSGHGGQMDQAQRGGRQA